MPDDQQLPAHLRTARNAQRLQDEKRRPRHFQVRLDQELADKLRHYANKHHGGVVNPALNIIVSRFFNGQ